MDKNRLCPYVRRAMMSSLPTHHRIATRIIYDYELIYITGGTTKLTVGTTEYICQKNHAVLLRPGIPHSFESIDGSELIQPHLHFDLIYNENSTVTPISFKDRPAMSPDELKLIQPDILDDHIPCVFTPYDPNGFSRLLFDIISLFENRAPNFELESKASLLRLLSLIFAQFDTVGKQVPMPHDTAVTVKNYIDSNFLQPITLEGLEQQFYVNKFTLIRNFKRMYGISPIAHYHNCRIEYAKTTLANTSRPIGSIAEELEYYDMCSFNRFFRTQTGISPKEYRNNRKNPTDK